MEVIGDYEIPDSWTAKGMNWNTPEPTKPTRGLLAANGAIAEAFPGEVREQVLTALLTRWRRRSNRGVNAAPGCWRVCWRRTLRPANSNAAGRS